MLKGRVSQGDPDIFISAPARHLLRYPSKMLKIRFDEYSHIHLTGILPALSESTRAAVNLMFDKARQAGLLITFDPNLRPQLWPSQDVMIQSINEMASKADIVLPGTAEGKILMGSDDPKKSTLLS